MAIHSPGVVGIRGTVPVVANVYENKSALIRIAGDNASHTIIGPARYEVAQSVNLRLSAPDIVETSTNAVIGGTAPPNTGLRYHLFRLADLSGLVGRELLGATFHIYNQNTVVSSNPTQTGPIQLHRILSGNTGWDEATATWNERNGPGNVTWAGTAGLRTAGTDYSATVFGQEPYPIYAAAPVPGWIDFDLDLTELASMITANDGFKAKMQNENQAYSSQVVFYTEEYADATKRPYATITLKPSALTGVEMNDVTEITMQATGTGAYYANDLSASSDSLHLPDGQIIVEKLNTNTVPSFSIYVAAGSSVVYKYRGPISA